MNKTYTPELTPEALERLRDYSELFRDDFRFKSQHAWSGVYLRGLLQDGERKSVEPMAHRVPRPAELLQIRDPDQALQQFLNQSPWDEQKVLTHFRAVMAETFADPAGIFVIDDTSFPKQGKHSVGVQRQYCGALGKRANCQVAPSVHYVSPKGHYPLAMRLYLPESWLDAPHRLEIAGVPKAKCRDMSKGQIALELLDQVRSEGLPGNLVVADAGYGVSGPFRQRLAERDLHYIVGVSDEMVVFTEPPVWESPGTSNGGRPRTRSRLVEDSPRPLGLKALAVRTPLRKVTWREGTKGKLSGRFAWLQVWPGHGWSTGVCAGAEPHWLLIEEQNDGKIKYAFSNLPPETKRLAAVRLWKSRWPVEQGYQQMKEELGLDHFEGRSWRGFHHHTCLVMLSYGFLVMEQLRAKEVPVEPGKKRRSVPSHHGSGNPSRLATTALANGTAGL